MIPPLLIFPDPKGPSEGGFLVFREPLSVFEGPDLARAEAEARRVGGVLAGGLEYARAETPAPGWWGVFAAAERLSRDQLLAWADAAVPDISTLKPTWSRERHAQAVAGVRAALARGDSYQINLTFFLEGMAIPAGPWSWRGALRLWLELLCPDGRWEGGQGHQGAFAWWGDDRPLVVSASPELFFERVGTTVTARPMKGTARRHEDPSEDARRRQALSDSPKDRAENLMITDMLRNDLGRLARPGGVTVPRLFDTEAYPTVWQMTSTVCAEVANEVSLVDLMRALAPCASITGAPKLRSQDLIEELEATPRGWYTGTLGWSSAEQTHFNVLIRTLVFPQPTLPKFDLGVGGGIVWESSADAEYDEALAKARFLQGRQRNFDFLESMLWDPGKGLVLAELHARRLERSVLAWGERWDPVAYERALAVPALTVPTATIPHKIRVLFTPAGEFRVEAQPLDAWPEEVSWALAEEPLADSELLFRIHKTTRRDVYHRAQVAGVQQTVYFNTRGELTESTSMNLALRFGDRWLTPALSSGLLAGTYREALLAEGRLTEAVLPVTRLDEADEIAFFNSIRGWKKGKPPRPTLR